MRLGETNQVGSQSGLKDVECVQSQVLQTAAVHGPAKSASPVFEIDPLHDARWPRFTALRPDASVFHRSEWLQALKICYGYEPVVFSSNPKGAALDNALVCCRVQSRWTGSRFVSLPFSDHCEPLVSDPEELDLLLAHICDQTDKSHLKYLEIRPVRNIPDPRRRFAISSKYYLHRLDISESEKNLFKRFHKDCIQRQIRRAERESLRYEAGCSETLLKYFYKLLIMSRRQINLPPQPLKWFRTLTMVMGFSMKVHVAFKGAIPVASILTLSNKKTLVYKYGCRDSRFSNLGGTAMLFWKAIQEAKADGFEELDLGRSDPDQLGLIANKEHWGAQRSTVHYWRYPAPAATVRPEGAIKYAKHLISIAPDASLAMLGNLLYRHIG